MVSQRVSKGIGDYETFGIPIVGEKLVLMIVITQIHWLMLSQQNNEKI